MAQGDKGRGFVLLPDAESLTPRNGTILVKLAVRIADADEQAYADDHYFGHACSDFVFL
jgi:hypothetical protein